MEAPGTVFTLGKSLETRSAPLSKENVVPGNQLRGIVDTGPRSAPLTYRSRSVPRGLFRPYSDTPRLVACVDDGDLARRVSSHALAIARSLGMEVTFARVIDAPGKSGSPADPVEWQLRQHSQKRDLRLFAGEKEAAVAANSVLLAGCPAEEISDWALEHGATLLVSGCSRSETAKGLGSTAQSLLDRGEHSLLLVPPGPTKEGGYRRIMVPVDGSHRGDAVLPVARRIARTHGADLVLVHVVPQAQILERERTPNLQRLSVELDKQQTRFGKTHLADLRSRSVEDGVEVRTIIRGPGDPRALLRETAVSESIDLIVMASHGVTGLDDVSCGSVAEYLAGHTPVPLLIVRPNLRCSFSPEERSCGHSSAFRLTG